MTGVVDRRWLVVSVHDVAAATEDITRRWIDELTTRGLRVSLLVIPGPWRGQRTITDAPELCDWLRELQRSGHDIAQHGWSHAVPDGSRRALAADNYDRLATRGCAEFWHLDTTSISAVTDLVTGRQWSALVMSQRPGSGLAGAAARATVHIAGWTVRRGRPLRVAAHPDDLDDPRTRRAVLTACDVALRAGHRSLTDADVVAGSEPRPVARTHQ